MVDLPISPSRHVEGRLRAQDGLTILAASRERDRVLSTLHESNRQTTVQVTRLTPRKRQGDRRATVDLLRRRILARS